MRTVWVIGTLILSLFENGTLAQPAKPARGLVAGLKGDYFNGPNFERKVLTRIDPAVDFDWNWQPPGSGVQREYFSVRWTGKLYAPVSGRYRFSAMVDDGVRVWVNGKKVIDEWRKQDDSHFVGTIQLNGRQLYDLRIEYYNDWKGSIISVYWELPDDRVFAHFRPVPRRVIDTKYLFTTTEQLRPVTAAVKTKTGATRLPATSVAAYRSVPAVPKKVTVKSAPIAAGLGLSANKPKPKPQSANPIVADPIKEPLETLKVGDVVVLRQVLFTQSEYTLLPTSYDELEKVVRALRMNPGFQIEVAGHTDNIGDKRLNQSLSENRAKVVASYLVRQGIAESRIRAKGYGGTRPIADNTTEAQRAMNRRVELLVN